MSDALRTCRCTVTKGLLRVVSAADAAEGLVKVRTFRSPLVASICGRCGLRASKGSTAADAQCLKGFRPSEDGLQAV